MKKYKEFNSEMAAVNSTGTYSTVYLILLHPEQQSVLISTGGELVSHSLLASRGQRVPVSVFLANGANR